MRQKASHIYALGLLGIVLAGIVYLLVTDRVAPVIETDLRKGIITPETEIVVNLSDASPGLRSVKIDLSAGGASLTLQEIMFSGKPASETVKFRLGRENIRQLFQNAPITVERNDLKLTLQISATDASISKFGKGNTARRTLELTVDLLPPQAEILACPAQIQQGRSASLVFRSSEPLDRASLSIEAGDNAVAFTAFPQQNNIYACVFTLPHNAAPESFQPALNLADPAGNVTRIPLAIQGLPTQYREDRINISPVFLREKAPEFMRSVPGESDFLALFLRMNNEVRKANYEELRALREQTEPVPLWQGIFLRLPGAIKRSEFADRRVYFYLGREVDRQVHQGIDLASVLRDKVPAAENGRVVFAGYLGIHGNVVLLDHGLGVQTLYSHLSRLDVKPGAAVRRGRSLGLTGTSGMAGGDHLHFEVFVGGISVEPDDWLAGAVPWQLVKTLNDLR